MSTLYSAFLNISHYLKRIFYRKSLVFIAIFCMVASAAITYFVVGTNHHRIAELEQQAQKYSVLIRDEWANANQLDQNANYAVTLSLLAHNNPSEAEALRNYYLKRLGQMVEGEKSLLHILQIAEQEREHQIDRINDTYLQQSSLEDTIKELEQKNTTYTNLAFYLQIIGLVLVIVSRETMEQAV